MKSERIRFSLQRPLQHSDPAMTSSRDLTLNHKLRKPLVEKLRRERINTCIEQLKSLLVPEFLKQQPDSNLEKADILEMTVCFLTQLQQQRNLLTHSNKLQTASDEKLKEADFSILSSKDHTSITQCSLERKDNSDLWRPW
ncbi:transcription factor HES-5-like [Simochromis diagramma]|uniref:transcription factor HES-5-like n=1 Tax=Simochromis diagramma TaxID=43689 RepID=UPI001A7E7AF6|nr:transcription factor HES-5-like [Simochromis diagramma]